MSETVRLFTAAPATGAAPLAVIATRADLRGDVVMAECFVILTGDGEPGWIPILPSLPAAPEATAVDAVVEGLRREAESRLRKHQAERAAPAEPAPAGLQLRESPDPEPLQLVGKSPEGARLLRTVLECTDSRLLRNILRGVLFEECQ